ncbi:IS110 family transposase [Corynebacterium parakroppenstedtii]|uniref:IS110 family transposase n=1 Tax=Corynebacterium parakroppenstedtii TaxID=2828363 RepID=UPI000AECB4CB|nr:IS110 family transposase [Corynebacterium parakroppenstedtii]MCF6820959.1 IS110 family transposase [Corynebacterium parakroppenstedtii]
MTTSLVLPKGQYFHHVCVLNRSGSTVLSQRVEHTDTTLTRFFTQFTTTSPTLVVVDQPNNIGRLTVTVAQATGTDVKYLPGPIDATTCTHPRGKR